MPTAYHMVHYRRFSAQPLQAGAPSLEAACRSALGHTVAGASLWERAHDRLLDLGPLDGRQLLLNRVVDLTSAVFGELCLAQTKGMQALLELQAAKVKLSDITTAEVYKLGERTAPKGAQFIRGMAYWIAIGNHLFFVKSQSMTSDNMTGYLDWLLRTPVNRLPSGTTPRYQAEFDRSQVGGDIGDVRTLRLSGKSVPQLAIAPANSPDREKTVKTSRRIAEKYAVFEQAVEVAKAVFGEGKTRSLVESFGPDEYLSAQTEFKVQGKRTQRSKDELKSLATEIANTSDAKVQVEGKDGKISDDDAILRTRMPFELESEDSNLLVFDNVSDQLQIVYQRFVDDGKIAAA